MGEAHSSGLRAGPAEGGAGAWGPVWPRSFSSRLALHGCPFLACPMYQWLHLAIQLRHSCDASYMRMVKYCNKSADGCSSPGGPGARSCVNGSAWRNNKTCKHDMRGAKINCWEGQGEGQGRGEQK